MLRNAVACCAVVFALTLSALAQTPAAGEKETGLAAVYSDKLTGHRTASGQVYDPAKLTAAHKTLPFGSKIKVTNTKNNKSVVLRINDRGPVQQGRVLDISPAAASKLGIHHNSTSEVTVEVVSLGDGKTTKQSAVEPAAEKKAVQ